MTPTGSLRTSRDFARVVRAGRRGMSDGITVFVGRTEEARPARLGLSVRATSGSAVTRNRIKRRIRAAWRNLAPVEGAEVVVQADRSTADAAFQDLENHLVKALAKAGGLA
jgi:ribonuclease P protein component